MEHIKIQIQEIDLEDGNGRPNDYCLTNEDLVANSIGDIPVVGDVLILKVLDENDKGTNRAFKVRTRLFDCQGIDNTGNILCNIVVVDITGSKEYSELIKS